MTLRSTWWRIGLGAWIAALPASADTFPGNDDNQGLDGPHITACWNDTGAIPTELTDYISYLLTTAAPFLSVTWGDCDAKITDARFDDNLVEDGTLGRSLCSHFGGSFDLTASTADLECDSAYVSISPTTIHTCGLNDSQVKRANWCHEMGHQLGLGHENSCMATGCFVTNTYSAHHISHLAAYNY